MTVVTSVGEIETDVDDAESQRKLISPRSIRVGIMSFFHEGITFFFSVSFWLTGAEERDLSLEKSSQM